MTETARPTPAEAVWIRENAWLPHHRETHAEYPVVQGACPCEYGQCGHCAAGRHDQCAELVRGHVATYLTTPDGYALAEVHEAGHPHHRGCPCISEHVRQDALW